MKTLAGAKALAVGVLALFLLGGCVTPSDDRSRSPVSAVAAEVSASPASSEADGGSDPAVVVPVSAGTGTVTHAEDAALKRRMSELEAEMGASREALVRARSDLQKDRTPEESARNLEELKKLRADLQRQRDEVRRLREEAARRKAQIEAAQRQSMDRMKTAPGATAK